MGNYTVTFRHPKTKNLAHNGVVEVEASNEIDAVNRAVSGNPNWRLWLASVKNNSPAGYIAGEGGNGYEDMP